MLLQCSYCCVYTLVFVTNCTCCILTTDFFSCIAAHVVAVCTVFTTAGLGIPAVAASGMSVANTIVSPWQHIAFLNEMKSKGAIVDRFTEF
jgi:hypothetical protein